MHYFTNNWHNSVQRDLADVYDAIKHAIEHQTNYVEIPNTAYPQALVAWFEATTHGLISIDVMESRVCSGVRVNINIDFSKLTLQEYIALRKSVGLSLKMKTPSLLQRVLLTILGITVKTDK